MRFLSVLFALYFAVLGGLPCTDEVPPAATGTTYVVSAGHRIHDEPGELDWCSPLCQCRCCPGAVMLTARLATFEPAPVAFGWGATTYAPAGPAALPVRPLVTPWQPPQRA